MYKFDYKINLEMKGTVSIPAEKEFVDKVKNKERETLEGFGNLLKREIQKEMNCEVEIKDLEIEVRK